MLSKAHLKFYAPNLLTPGNDPGDASDSISQSNQIGSRSFRSIEHERVHKFHSHSSLVDKHERAAYYITIQIDVTKALIDVDT